MPRKVERLDILVGRGWLKVYCCPIRKRIYEQMARCGQLQVIHVRPSRAQCPHCKEDSLR